MANGRTYDANITDWLYSMGDGGLSQPRIDANRLMSKSSDLNSSTCFTSNWKLPTVYQADLMPRHNTLNYGVRLMVTELILVDQIRVDLDLQMRFATKPDERHVESLMRAMKDDDGFLNKYPLDLADIDGVLHPVDGHHRLEAAKRLGLPAVSARIVARSRPEAIKAAAGANDHDGVAMKRTVRDRRKAVEQILSNPETRVMVDSEIAKIAGCSIQTVGNIREEKPEWQCDRRVKADGTIVTVSGRPPKRQSATNFQLEVADKGESAMVAKLAAERDSLRAELDRLRGGFKVASGHTKITLEIRPFTPVDELVRVLLEFYGREKVADIAELLAERIEAEEAKLAAMSV